MNKIKTDTDKVSFLVTMLRYVADPRVAAHVLNRILNKYKQPRLTKSEIAEARAMADAEANFFGETQ